MMIVRKLKIDIVNVIFYIYFHMQYIQSDTYDNNTFIETCI